MKKNLFGWLAMAAMLVGTGCSTDEVVNDYSPENAIQFGTYVGRDAQGRASIISADDLATLGFGVFTYYTDSETKNEVYDKDYSIPNFMYNQKVEGILSSTQADNKETNASDVTTWTNGWYYSPLKYWPNDVNDKLTFFAYAPYSDSNADVDSPETYDNISFPVQTSMIGDPIISFTVNDEVKNQTDFLISKTDNRNMVKNATPGVSTTNEVNFQFVHALARIGFTVKAIVDDVDGTPNKALDANTTIVVKKVVLAGEAGVLNAEPTAGCFYTQGTVNLNQQNVNVVDGTTGRYQNVNWTTTGSLQRFILTDGHFKDETGTNDTRGFILNNENSEGPNDLNKAGSYIMVIPQDFTSGGLYVYVEYDVITTDPAVGNSTVTNHISTEVNNINFQSGKAYLLNLQLGMTSVKVTTSVENWSTESGTSVDLPANT